MKARASALAMFNLKKIRKYLDKSTCLKIANATIFSHMDYCNGLFINLPASTLHPLQRIQNYTAKIILGRSKYDSASAALKELHILPLMSALSTRSSSSFISVYIIQHQLICPSCWKLRHLVIQHARQRAFFSRFLSHAANVSQAALSASLALDFGTLSPSTQEIRRPSELLKLL
ncbi:putative RNA-directed DNA polymerase from transposon X-element [Apostichopus japonicus]|uniref:Putative RNA-directed DNA polymerase from transposon X-element n=1 Tax=Stichopus japonicus TaxID=307972 RepID=A0A2G8K4A3_STIJA|nr:putative RNA-directed DNA polymerase from transposon X-element [Apostichopus japonicus]